MIDPAACMAITNYLDPPNYWGILSPVGHVGSAKLINELSDDYLGHCTVIIIFPYGAVLFVEKAALSSEKLQDILKRYTAIEFDDRKDLIGPSKGCEPLVSYICDAYSIGIKAKRAGTN